MKAMTLAGGLLMLALMPAVPSNAGGLGQIVTAILGIDHSDAKDPSLSAGSRKGPDRESRACLACHDGVTASDTPPAQRHADAVGISNADNSHPVGVSYSETTFDKRRQYNTEAILDPAIRLVDGMVSCVSCHSIKTDASKPADYALSR